MDDDNHTSARRASRAIVIGVSLLLASTWVIPGAPVIENRKLDRFPEPSAAGIATAADFRAVDSAMLDHLPVRGGVVAVLGGALTDAGFSPTSEVFRGPSGEPFVSTDFLYTCYSQPQVEQVDTISRFVRAVLAEHKTDFLYAIAPDKSSIQRAALGPAARLIMPCADANRQILQGFADEPDSPLLVGWDALSSDPGPVYLTNDSHWTPHGGAVFAKLLIDRLGAEGIAPPGVFDPGAVKDGKTQMHRADLFKLMGIAKIEPLTRFVSDREGVTTTHQVEKHDGVSTQRWVSTGPNLIEGRTLVLHDSFFLVNDDVLAPYFADLTSLPLTAINTPGALATIDGYDHVIVLQVQRFVPSFIGDIPTAAWITAGR